MPGLLGFCLFLRVLSSLMPAGECVLGPGRTSVLARVKADLGHPMRVSDDTRNWMLAAQNSAWFSRPVPVPPQATATVSAGVY